MMKELNFCLLLIFLVSTSVIVSCGSSQNIQAVNSQNIKLITLDPGHFHAALVQKSMYPNVDSTVYVYAPEGREVKNHLALIDKYNTRPQDPTMWKQKVYTGQDYLKKMFAEKAGNVVVIAGNNLKKTEYIKEALDSGFNVLGDKPLAINEEDFKLLEQAFDVAKKKGLLLYDIMTERFQVQNVIQKELSAMPELFGEFQKGTPDDPAVIKESVHHFYKQVSGQPLVRPAWFFDVEQEGDGIVDVTTHLVDLVQWQVFPGVSLDYRKDISMHDAKRWPTKLSREQFKMVTKSDTFPAYLNKDIHGDSLYVFSNGSMNYSVKGINAKVSVLWNFEAPEGTGDTHFSILRGTKANLIIRQGKEQKYQPVLYVEPAKSDDGFQALLERSIEKLKNKYPGLSVKKNGTTWEVVVPEKYKVGHEEHFAEVTRKYLDYLRNNSMPEWEVPNMLAKYFTTTQALQKAMKNQ